VLLQDPFGVLKTAADGRILQVLANADSWFSIAQAWDLSGISSRDQVRRALSRMAEDGILIEERAANAYRYRFNTEHLLADGIKSIATARARFIQQLETTLSGWEGLLFAALFGSAARGDMHTGSDIDIFLVRLDDHLFGDLSGEWWQDQVTVLEQKVTGWTGNPCNVLHFRELEVKEAGDTDTLARIKREGIPLVGSRSWLTTALRDVKLSR
jgi:hypothetical protein